MLENPQIHYDPQFVQQQSNATLQYPRDVAYSHRQLEGNTSDPHYDGADPADSHLYINSQLNTAYNSPDQSQLQISQYAAPEFQSPYHNPYNLGVGLQYDEYGNLTYPDADYHTYPGIQQTQYEQHPGSAYYNHPGLVQPQYPAPVGYYTDSPPTPAASDQIGDRKRVKGSNRHIAPHKSAETPRSTPDNTSHPAKASTRKSSENPAKPPKHTKNKKEKGDVPILTAPLSELTKSYNIPLKNMDEWVNRSVETRLKECTKKEGWIPRPMNSFMLYRSAYAERTKHWCLQNNHQVVSSVSGLSWPMEPPEIREQFIEYARQERENHAKAHPGYKFSAAKTDASRRKRKGATKEQDDDESVDLEELDYDWQPSRSNKNIKRKGRAKRAKTGYDSEDPVNLEIPLEEYETHSVSNPGKSRLPKHDGLEHYHEVMVDADFFETKREEDASFLEAEAPNSNGEPKDELVGLPGADHHELLLDPQLNGDNINPGGNEEAGMPLDPYFDPTIQGGYDFDQLNELFPNIGEVILQTLNEPGFFDIPESKTVGPSVGENQQSHQNQAENGHQKNVPNEGLNEYEYAIQNDFWDVHQHQFPEFEDEKPDEFPNTPQQKPNPGEHGPKTQEIPETFDQGKVNVEKSDDEKRNEETPSNGKPRDAKPGDAKLGDAKPDDEEPGDAKPDDEEPGDAKLGEEKPDDEEPGDAKPDDEEPGDAKPGEEKPDDEEPGDEEPGDKVLSDEKPGDEELFAEDLFDGEPLDEEPGAEEPGDEVLFDEELFDEELFDEGLFNEERVDEKPGDEKPGDGEPSIENPDDEIVSREKLDHQPGGIKKPSSTKKRSR